MDTTATENVRVVPPFFTRSLLQASLGVFFLTAALNAFVFWSWKIGLGVLTALLVIRLTPLLRNIILLAWTLAWGAVCIKFIWWFFYSIARHHTFWDRLPTYIAAVVIGLIIFCGSLAPLFGDVKPQLPPNDKAHHEPPKDAPMEEAPTEIFDPYAILELSPNASMSEIKAAYREQMNLYHPDKVAHLGSAIRAIADLKTREIQRAFEALQSNKN